MLIVECRGVGTVHTFRKKFRCSSRLFHAQGFASVATRARTRDALLRTAAGTCMLRRASISDTRGACVLGQRPDSGVPCGGKRLR